MGWGSPDGLVLPAEQHIPGSLIDITRLRQTSHASDRRLLKVFWGGKINVNLRCLSHLKLDQTAQRAKIGAWGPNVIHMAPGRMKRISLPLKMTNSSLWEVEKRESWNELQAFCENEDIHPQVCKKSMRGMFNSICLGGRGDENRIKSDKNNKVI